MPRGGYFEIYPVVEPLFKSDMQQQGHKLLAMINTAVYALDNLEPVVPAIKDMGARHAGYGVSDEDYGKVDDALLWTLHKGLGDEFTPEVEDAWIIAYTTSADTMKAGAVEQAA
jgi:hemoglobin-like flavoprotein